MNVGNVSAGKTAALPMHIADWAGVILPWNGTDGGGVGGAGGWLFDSGGRPCVSGGGNETVAGAAAIGGGSTEEENIYVRRLALETGRI